MASFFKIRYEPTDSIIELLDSVTLGTNGAHYRHLDTKERILESDEPLFYTLERQESAIANITFCRRNKFWYIRYFAFSPKLQGEGQVKSKANKDNLLRREISTFFNEVFDGKHGEAPDSFYAYIDPQNQKSLWMSENFGFESVAEITTQTYSRTKPKKSTRLVELKWEDISHLVEEGFSNYNYFYHTQTAKPPIYGIKDENGKILAAAKVSIANWEIKRLPGKMGGILTKMIPYIPVINKLIRPKSHRFIVPEAVFAINNDSELVEELFDGILQKENLNVIIWWIDVKDHLYRSLRSEVKWGLLDKLVGASKAHVVQKWNPNKEREYDNSKPVFTDGFDFI